MRARMRPQKTAPIRPWTRALARAATVLSLVAAGLAAATGSATAVSTACTTMNSASVDGVYNVATADGDFEVGEVLSFEVDDTSAPLATLVAVQDDLPLPGLPITVTVAVPGRLAFSVPASGHWSLVWSVPLPVDHDPTWLVSCNADSDSDGIPDQDDNCPQVANPDQADADADGRGDLCDTINNDVDADGIRNEVDNCPTVANPDQADGDADGLGDACDPSDDDPDRDGVYSEDDNCPTVPNADQADGDGDGTGDDCDGIDDDTDRDGVFNNADNCPSAANATQADADGDGIGDACDPVNDKDVDNDTVPNLTDNCPATWNPNQADADHDGAGNACDPDDDNDGVPDAQDACPLVVGARADGCPDAAPAVAFTAPRAGGAVDPVRGTTLAVTASDDSGVASVTFAVGSRTLCVDTTAPYACAWRPTERETGNRVVTATARDGGGHTATASRAVVVGRFTPTLKAALGAVPGQKKKVRVTGRLILPAGTTLYACSGTVAVTVKAGRTTKVLKAPVRRTGSACTFTTGAMAKPKTRATVVARFAGNAVLNPR